MQTEVEAYICRHVLQRVIDGHFYLADHATLICGAVDLEHPSERRVGIGTAAEHAAYVEYGTRHMPPEPFMEPTAREAGEIFVRDLRKLMK